MIHLKFGMLDQHFYFGELVLFVFFPMYSIGISKLVRDLILTLQENKELVTTINNILQVLPESVIINSIDAGSNKFVLKY